MPRMLKILLFFTVLMPAMATAQTITGTVFRDFNANGTKDNTATFNEVGVGGITVNCTDSAGGTGTTTTSTATATLGNYSLTGCTGATRVEFSWATASGDYSAPVGSGSNTSVQFINATRTGVDFGINAPDDYSDNVNPKLITSVFTNGNPLGGGTSGASSSLVRFDYTDNGQTSSTNNENIVTNASVGTVWGLGYQRDKDRLFASAFLKRHTGLGPMGIGGLYTINNAKTSSSPTINSLDLTTLGLNFGTVLDNTSRGLQADKTQPQHDASVFDQIGKVGIGDIDVSSDDRRLYVMNLFEKKVHVLDITGSTPTLLHSHEIPDPGCIGGAWRPFAIELYHGELYVGGVCDAQTSGVKTDLRAFILKLNGSIEIILG